MKKLGIILVASLVVLLSGCGESSDTITVLTSSGYEPYEMVDTNGELTGFDIELMEALAAEAGLEIEWKDVNFDGIIASLQAGQAELAIAGISPTDERKEMVDFSDVYYNSEAGLENYMIYSDDSTIADLSSLDGLVVGAQLGTIQASYIESIADEYNFTVDLRNTNTQIIEEIKAGRVDVLVVESLVADSILEANSGLSKTFIDDNLDSLNGNAIAFTKGSEYVDIFNEALQTLKDNGTLDDLIAKWFN